MLIGFRKKIVTYWWYRLYVHDMTEFDKCADIDSSIEYKYNTD